MSLKKIKSKDGSDTLFSEKFNEHYHSTFGAVQESEHIFINAGLKPVAQQKKEINIFEVGFGTGLNALLTYKFAFANNLKINYHSIEAFPVDQKTISSMNYPEILGLNGELFKEMHSAENNIKTISEFFSILVITDKIQNYTPLKEFYDIIYFDAFSPGTQPGMWTEEIFGKIYDSLKIGGILTTYSSKGIVKRALKSVGFKIEKLPGPPGKREFVKAVKN